MMVTYAVEPWGQYKREACHIWDKHWQEIAIDRDKIKLNVDYAQYDALDAQGALHIVVARSAGRMVGYWLGIIRPHLHYKDSLSAFTDIYYVDPEFRKGRVGIQLFKEVERSLFSRGVQKIFSATKKNHNIGAVFERLGYTETETVYTKVIR